MSTRDGHGREPAPADTSRIAEGVRAALAHAAWGAPLLAPIGLVQALLVAAPWLDSLEADRQGNVLSGAADWVMRHRLESALHHLGGTRGAFAICIALVLAWCLVLRLAGPLRRRPWTMDEPSHRAHVARLAMGLAGAFACLVSESAGMRLDRVLDAVTSMRPTGPASLAMLALSQAGRFVVLGAVAGATLAAARLALRRRARMGALAVVGAIGLGSAAIQHASRDWLVDRFDVGRKLEDVAGDAGSPRTIAFAVLARDREWLLTMQDGVSSVRFTPECAARIGALLQERGGWTRLADSGERYVIGERLVALDPEAARLRALACTLRPGQPSTAYFLLVAMGSVAPSAATRRVLDELEGSTRVHVGPQGRLLLARARAQSGDRVGAEADLALLDAEGEAAVIANRGGASILLSRYVHGIVTGRLLVDGAPARGRVGLVGTRDLFTLRAGGDVPETFLLRLVQAADCGEDGRFELTGLPEGEMALVLRVPDGLVAQASTLGARSPLPQIDVAPATPSIDVGDVQLVVIPASEARSPG